MTIYNWLSIFGIPALLSAGFGYLLSQVKHNKQKNRALEMGVQALLRDRLLQGYRHFFEKGCVNYDERLNMENVYRNYHNLGENGIMDDYHRRFLALPIKEAKIHEQSVD